MSWVGVMIGVGVGAASGGIMTGLNGGDAGDILQSMAIGGAMGGVGGAAGGALAGGAGGAAAGTAGGAAGGTGGGALGGAAGAGTGTLGAAGTAAAESMLAPTAMGLSSVGSGALGGGAGGALGGGAGSASGALGAAGTAAAESMLSPTAMGLSSVGGGVGGATTGVASSAPSWGTSLVSKAFDSPVTGNIAQIGGKALEQGVYGAGIGALGSGLTGQDIGKGAGIGFLGGAVGGAGQSALASQAGTATGALGTAAKFAAESPTITSGLISVPTSMALNSMMAPETPTLPTQNQPKSQFKWSGPSSYNYSPETYTPNTPQWDVYKPQYYAAGGITDLDGYASQAQNIATGGITQIPNPAEVADPEGYGQESVHMMAGGGMTKIADALVQSSPIGLIAGWDSASEVPLIGGLFDKPEALPATATLTPEEKQKLMAMMAAQQGQQQMAQQPQQMARGGIADLGDYAAGGRPNLLHGAGDGVSDDIPASIAGKQPARLAAGEYVVPSRIVSELGNGSTDAGAKRLDEMVQKIQAGRKKTMGSKKQFANDSKAYKHLPA